MLSQIRSSDLISDNVRSTSIQTRKIKFYSRIGILWGFHYPSLSSLFPDVLFNRLMIKSTDGEHVEIHCLDNKEAQYADELIKSKLDKYGYHSCVKNHKLIVTLPWHATSRMLKKNKAKPLFATVVNGIEYVFFELENGFIKDGLMNDYKKSSLKFKKEFHEPWIYPREINLKFTNVRLPEFRGKMSLKYIYFLMEKHRTEEQVKTYDALFLLATNGNPIHLIQPEHLKIEIVNLTNLPHSTVRNHLDKDHLFHDELFRKVFDSKLDFNSKSVSISKYIHKILEKIYLDNDSIFQNITEVLEYAITHTLTQDHIDYSKNVKQSEDSSSNFELNKFGSNSNDLTNETKHHEISKKHYENCIKWILKNRIYFNIDISGFLTYAVCFTFSSLKDLKVNGINSFVEQNMGFLDTFYFKSDLIRDLSENNENVDPTTEIGGGNIKVHKGK